MLALDPGYFFDSVALTDATPDTHLIDTDGHAGGTAGEAAGSAVGESTSDSMTGCLADDASASAVAVADVASTNAARARTN